MKRTSPTHELAFRVPMLVTQARLFRSDGIYPVCPQCRISMDREYQNFCCFCGQRLEWKGYKNAEVIYPQDSKGHH